MKIVKDSISLEELKLTAKSTFGNLVKAVVDIEKEIMAVDAELHSDEEALLLERGSKQENLWGINIYPEEKGDNFIEFDSMINLRPSQGNRSRGVDDFNIREKIKLIANKLIKNEISA
ncbi:hypothetical protein KJ586_02885 [Patescibacteria group bacterium]|nr:hypothetical protein [Patescibacteria group bacterium]MCG2690716.1 DUF5674 family protein [Candidatus Parcubacteria bacterium]